LVCIQATEQRLASSIAAIRSGDPLQGLLSFFELTLEVGAGMTPTLANLLRACSDERVKALLASLTPTNDADAMRMALAEQAKLRPTVASPCPVLDAFEASLRMTLGERQLSKELLTRALVANPRLVGAYKQLGDVYLGEFDARRAWRCWDIARTLCPSHPLLKDTAALEQMLVSEHPEYFGQMTVG
jgi:tetratricopeptide (TPR) repeat protein